MVTVNLAYILASLPVTFDQHMQNLWNREARLLGRIPVKSGHGQNCAFIVNVGGQTATTFADGYDIQTAEYGSDVYVPAALDWAQYRSSFVLTARAIDVAASSRGGAEELMNLFAEHIFECSTSIMSKLNSDLDAGAGTSDSLLGLAASLVTSGSYAGISSDTYPLIKSNVTAVNGALTSAALAAMETKIFIASGKMPNLIVMTPALHEKYTALGLGTINTVSGIPYNQFNLSVRDDGVFWKGIPVIRDKDMASGTVKMLNTDYLHVKVLPPVPTKDSVVYQLGSMEDGAGNTGLPIIIESLAKSGPSSKFTVRTPSLQLVVPRPNAHGLMTGCT